MSGPGIVPPAFRPRPFRDTPGPPMTRPLAPAAALLLAAAAVPAAFGQARVDVKQVDWGFGGRVLPGHFAQVSVLIDNPTKETFDGAATLYRANYINDRRGATLSQPLFLSAFGERRVPFYVFPLDAGENWVLELEPAGGGDPFRLTLPKPGHGPPRVAAFVAPDDFTANVPKVARFDESLFPPNPAAADGLRAAILDHAPDWLEARRRSFLTWLEAGGVVHLLPGPDGQRPRFAGELAVLNEPSDEFAVGAGRAIRHAVRRGDVTAPQAERLFLANAADPPLNAEEGAFVVNREQRAGRFPLDYDPARIEDDLLSTLRRMVRPEHRWVVIQVICLAYVAAIFPGVFLVGRERRGYPATLALLIAVTLAFGWALRSVGRRGYGEALSVRSTALVKALPGGRGLVTQWSDAFVTDGGDYALAVPGGPALISTAQDSEPVKGAVVGGAEARLVADVPPFSSRAFVARNVRDGVAPAVELLSAATGRNNDGTGERLRTFSVALPGGFAPFRVLAVHRRRCYPLAVSPSETGAGRATLTGEGFPLSNLVVGYGVTLMPGLGSVAVDPYGRGDEYQYVDRFGNPTYGYETDLDLQQFRDQGLDAAARKVIAQDLGLTDDADLYRLSAPAGRVRVYAVAGLPPGLRVLGGPGEAAPADPLPNQQGTAVYAFDFPL